MKKIYSTLAALLFCSFVFCQNPQMLKDVSPGNNTGTIQQIVKTSNYTFFNEDDDGNSFPSLFRTDGTTSGTIKVDLTYTGHPEFTGAKAEKLAVIGNKVVFGGTNSVNYGEIWVSDGTQAGTIGLDRFQPTTLNTPPIIEVTSMGNYAYYSVVDANNHAIIKRTDGTVAGTSLVYDFTGFNGIPRVVSFIPINGILYFDVWDIAGTGADQLWRSDGTTAGTYILKNFGAGILNSQFMPGGNLFYFVLSTPTGAPSTFTNTLWKSDGTVGGTAAVKAMNIGASNTNGFPQNAAIGNTFYFASFSDANGKELWKSDGTDAGTVLVYDFNAGTTSSNPSSLTVLNNNLYFRVLTPASGNEIWKYDGVSTPTLVKDINPGAANSGAINLTLSNNTILFSASNSINGTELWITDGTPANTVMVADINPGAGNSSPNTFTTGNPVYFAATNGLNGVEVFKYDNNGDVMGGPHKFYVNDNSLTGDVFTKSAGNDNNNGSKVYPFATLGAGYNRAQAGDTIFIDAGSYPMADFTIDKGVTILGTNYNISPNNPADKLQINPTRNTESIISGATINLAAANISLQGLTFDPGNKSAMSLNFNLVSPATPQNYGNISLKKNRFIINSGLAQVIFLGVTSPGVLADAATAPSALISSDYSVTDNRFEKLNTTSGNTFSIHGVKNVTIDNNSFVVTGPAPRTQNHANMGNNSVVDNVSITNNTVDRAGTFILGSRYANAVITGNKIYNTANAVSFTNAIPESSNFEFSNNLLDGSAGILPIVIYTRSGGGATGASSVFKAENNIITCTAVAGTTTLLGSFNIAFINTVLSPSLILRSNTMNYGGNFSTIEGQFIMPIVIRGKLANASVDHNELILAGTNLQPKNPANLLPVCPAISLYSDNGSNSVIPPGAVINILNNKVQGFKYSFIIFDPTNAAGTGDPFTGFGNLSANIAVNVHENSFTTDSMSINNGSVGYPIDASCNWYGSSAVQNLIGKFSTDLDNIYVPYLSNGTDNNAATGFQPVPGSCNGQPLQARLDGFTNITCNGANNGTASVTVFNGVAPYVFAWTKDGNPLFISNVEDPTNFGPGTYHLSITDALGTNIILDENSDIRTINVTITEPPLLTANAGGTNANCSNGSNGTAFVTAGGGTVPYTYAWSNGATTSSISNLTTGTYTVTVTDAKGCTKQTFYEVIQLAALPPTPTVTAATAVTFCAGGAVTLTSNAASGNQWYKDGIAINGSTTATLNANVSGSYTVRVTQNTCQSAVSNAIVVTVNPIPPTPAITAGSATTFCAGGNVTLTSNAASGNQWYKDGVAISGSTGATLNVTTGGSYTSKTTLNGCESSVSNTVVVVINPIPPTPTITAGSAIMFCNGGNVTLTSNAATGNQWYNGATSIAGATNSTYSATTSGNYSVKVSQNGCVSASSNILSIIVNTPSIGSTVNWNGSQLSIATGFAAYQWFLNGSSVAGATSSSYTPLVSGLYKVTITDANGCTATSTEFNLVATSITDVMLNGVLYSINPNPAKDELFLKIRGINLYKVQMRIINGNGTEVIRSENVNQSMVIPVKHLPSGMYYIMLSSKKEKAVFKIIVNH